MTSNTTPTSLAAEENERVHKMASECRRIAGVFGPGFRLPVFMRDVADEIERLYEQVASLTPATDERLAELMGEARTSITLCSGSCDKSLIDRIDTALANREQS